MAEWSRINRCPFFRGKVKFCKSHDARLAKQLMRPRMTQTEEGIVETRRANLHKVEREYEALQRKALERD